MTPSHLTLNDLETSNSRSLRFRSFVSCKGVELGNMLLSHLTLSDLERSTLRCRIFSKIDTCIVRYCVRVNPRFQLIYSAALSFFIQDCRKLLESHQLQLSSRAPRSMDLLLYFLASCT